MFGPEYQKINGIYKRDEKGVILPGEWSQPEFGYLADNMWRWTEKVDGTNIRLHYNGESVTIGGRTDKAQVPAKLVQALAPYFDVSRWRKAFDDDDVDDVTVYGEGYGAGIQSGGTYRPDQSLIVFDVLVGGWWLSETNVADVANKLGLDTVFTMGNHRRMTLNDAIRNVESGAATSDWTGAPIEGFVGVPLAPLYTRKGDRVITKVKVKDFTDYERKISQ